jgi:ELWxxDGT repeat protein
MNTSPFPLLAPRSCWWSAAIVSTALGLLSPSVMQAGEPQLVADLNVRGGGVQAMMAGGDRLFFTTMDPDIGFEAWTSDGTVIGTRPLRDIAPGRRDASPILGATLSGRTWFSAFTASSGREPWVSDGSGGGTLQAGDLRTDTDADGNALGSDPVSFADLGNGSVVFLATTQAGVGLYRSNGNPGGTILVKTLGATRGNASVRRGAVRIPSLAKAVVICNGQAWVTDGSEQGTFALALPPATGQTAPVEAVAAAGGVFVGNPGETGFWYTDGSQANTRAISAGGVFYFPTDTTGGRLVFMGGRRLRSSDGTQAGTTIIRDVDAFYSIGAANGQYVVSQGAPGDFRVLLSDGTAGGTTQIGTGVYISNSMKAVSAGGASWFVGYVVRNGKNDRQLWRIQGTTLSEVKVMTAVPASNNDPDIGLRFDAELAAVGDALFVRDRGKLYGVDAASREVTTLQAGLNSNADGRVQGLRLFGDGLLLWADHLGGGQADDKRPYFYAPGAAPIQLSTIRNPSGPGPLSLDSRGDFLVQGSVAWFPANNDLGQTGVNGMELWRTDGTPNGTALVKDIIPGPQSGLTRMLGPMPGDPSRAIMFADSSAAGGELFVTDGTSAGTMLIKDINPGTASSIPAVFTPMGSYALFSAQTAAQGRELWRTDGTANGTVLVKDIMPGSGHGMDRFFTNLRKPLRIGTTAYFMANDGTAGWELWKSDGTEAGTVLVKDIKPGSATSNVRDLTAFGGKLYFTADDGVHGRELWTSDGTTGGTVMVRDINPGAGSSCNALPVQGNPTLGYGLLTVSGGRLWFCADDGVHGLELWSSDGTAGGTGLVKDIRPGPEGAELRGLIDVDGVLCFAADDGISGVELWQSDGTSAGTFLAGDINTGSFDSDPFYLDPSDMTNARQLDGSYLPDAVVLGGTLYFPARAESVGRELWSYTPAVLGQTGVIAFGANSFSGSEASGQALITVTRTGGSGAATVTLTTTGGTAAPGADFTAFIGAVTFNPGETSRSVSIPVVSDAIAEGAETFTVALSTPTGGDVLGLATATVQIVDGGSANQPPTATPLSLVTAVSTPMNITLGGSDPEGAVVTVASVGAPSAGSLSGSGSSRTYTPPPGFSGTATFVFTVSDGVLISAPATVTITVGSAAVPGDLNGSGTVTFEDLSLFLSSYGKSSGDAGYLAGANLATAGSSASEVDFDDLTAFLALYPR